MSAKTILYVEDNEMNRKIVRDLLKRTKYQLIEAHDGEAGVAKALEVRPDLVLMDVQLPKMSGIDATRKWASEGFTRPWPDEILMDEKTKALVDKKWKELGIE